MLVNDLIHRECVDSVGVIMGFGHFMNIIEHVCMNTTITVKTFSYKHPAPLKETALMPDLVILMFGLTSMNTNG